MYHKSLSEIRNALHGCVSCPLKTQGHVVPRIGSSKPRLMLVGEGPGEAESIKGEPFCGPAGKVLRRILNSIPLTMDDIYITNTVKHRPPNNRKPERDETTACAQYLVDEVEILSPHAIVCLGRVAAEWFYERSQIPVPKGSLRGRTFHYGDKQVIITWHPSYLLRAGEMGDNLTAKLTSELVADIRRVSGTI